MKREHEAKQRQQVAESGTGETEKWAEEAIVDSKIWLPVACAFVLLCALVWLNEILDLPHLLLGAPRTLINWRESISETIVIAIVGFIVMSKLIRDVTERRRMEEALRESEEKFRTVADFTYAWEYWIAPDGSCVYVSPSCERITGYRASEFLQDANLLRTIIHPDDWETFANHRHKVLEAGGVLPIDFRIVTRSGAERWISHICQPIYSSNGRCLGLRGSNRDITERVRAENALHKYTVRLKARNEELDAFAHTVAHGLKNPLALVIGFTEELGEYHIALSDEKLRDCLHSIAENSRKMNSIIDALLLLAKVRETKIDIEPLHIANIVAQVRQRLAYMIAEYQAEIVLPDAWPAPLGYDLWIEEVWVNYISNAIKYGGQPPRVELGATVQADGMLRFWVRDNGPGLTPEEQARLFTPFTRLDLVRAKGHGLGLSIVRRIVEKLDGQVGIESKVGQGSVFSFTLPAVQAEDAAASSKRH